METPSLTRGRPGGLGAGRYSSNNDRGPRATTPNQSSPVIAAIAAGRQCPFFETPPSLALRLAPLRLCLRLRPPALGPRKLLGLLEVPGLPVGECRRLVAPPTPEMQPHLVEVRVMPPPARPTLELPHPPSRSPAENTTSPEPTARAVDFWARGARARENRCPGSNRSDRWPLHHVDLRRIVNDSGPGCPPVSG